MAGLTAVGQGGTLESNQRGDNGNTDPSIEDVVHAVSMLGERTRKLATDLAVAVARIQQDRRDRGTLTDDVLDLVARVTRLTQSVSDAVSVIEKGLPQTKTSSRGLWQSSREVGIPDEATLKQLTRSLDEALQLAALVFHLVRDETASGPRSLPDPLDQSGAPWSDESPDRKAR